MVHCRNREQTNEVKGVYNVIEDTIITGMFGTEIPLTGGIIYQMARDHHIHSIGSEATTVKT